MCMQTLREEEISKGKYSGDAHSEEIMSRKDIRRSKPFGIAVFRLYSEK